MLDLSKIPTEPEPQAQPDAPQAPKPLALDLSKIPTEHKPLHDSLSEAGNFKPDEAAKVFSLAKKTNLDPNFIAKNLDTAQAFADKPTLDMLDYIQQNLPATAKHLSDPKNMAVAQHDVHNLAAHEAASQAHSMLDDFWGSGFKSSSLGRELRGLLGDPVPFAADAPPARTLAAAAGAMLGDYPLMTIGGLIGSGAVMAGTSVAAAPAALLAAAGVAGMAGTFALPAMVKKALNDQYEKGLPTSMSDVLKRSWAIAYEGHKQSAVGALTAIAGGKAALLAGGTLAKSFVGMASRVAAEALTMEVAGKAVEGQAPSFRGAAEGLVFLAGAHAAGSVAGHAVDFLPPDKAAEAAREALTHTFGGTEDARAKASKVRELDEPAYIEHMNAMGKPVLMPREAFERFSQSANTTPEQAASELGASSSYADGVGHVEIPYGEWMSKKMDAHRLKLLDDITRDPNANTTNQRREVQRTEIAASKADQEKLVRDTDAMMKDSPESKAGFDAALETAKNIYSAVPIETFKAIDSEGGVRTMTELERHDHVQGEAELLARVAVREGQARGISPGEYLQGILVRRGQAGQVQDMSGKPLTSTEDKATLRSNEYAQARKDDAEIQRARAESRGATGGGAGEGGVSEALRGGAEALRLRGLLKSSDGPNLSSLLALRHYAEDAGLPLRRQAESAKVDPARATRIADAYEAMQHDPENPEVKSAYAALIRETLAQYQTIKGMGLKIEPIPKGAPNPYHEGPKMVHPDVRRGHLWFYPTEIEGGQDFPLDNPLLAMTDEKIGDMTLRANDVFRIVHDIFGHTTEGNGFGAIGEENAWQAHMRMYSPEAARAMTSETRGQNSWVNFHPKSEANRTNPGSVYATQKTGLLPEWAMNEGLVPDAAAGEAEMARRYRNVAEANPAVYEEAKTVVAIAAKHKQPKLDEIGKRLAELIGGKWEGRVKAAESLTAKVVRKVDKEGKLGYDVLAAHDVAAGSIISEATWETLGPAVEKLIDEHGLELEVTLKEGGTHTPNAFGYQGVQGNINLGDGIWGEIQIQGPNMNATRSLTHDIYDVWRDEGPKDIQRIKETDATRYAQYKSDIKRSESIYNAYWDSVSSETKALISAWGKRREALTSKTLTPEAGTQALPSNTSGPESASQKSLPSGSLDRSAESADADGLSAIDTSKESVAGNIQKVKYMTKAGEMDRLRAAFPSSLKQAALGEDPRAKYLTPGRIVELFAKQDPTSLGHELSHDWVQQMFEHVKSGKADEQYLADWKVVADRHGIKADQTSLTTEQQEGFASDWEKYRAKGEAPSPALRGIFERMMDWITQVYGDAKEALGGDIDPAMKEFFDRKLASRDEIAAALKEAGHEPDGIPGADKASQAQHKSLADEARRQAEDILLKPQLEELSKANKAKLATERVRVTREVTNQVNQEPVFKALSLLNVKGKAEAWAQSHKYINDSLGEPERVAFDMIAEDSGFSSGDEMAKKILLTDPKEAFDKTVKERVDTRMDSEFAALKDTGALREQAMKAVHSDKMTELLALERGILNWLMAKAHEKANEMNMLRDVNAETKEQTAAATAEKQAEISAKQREDAKIAAQAAKENARIILNSKPIGEAGSFRRYLTAERNAAAKSARLAARGEYEAAAKAKTEQMNAHALAAEAMRLKDRIDRWVESIHKQQMAEVKTWKQEEHFYQAADLMRRFGFDRQDYIGANRKETLIAWAERMEEQSSAVEIPDWIKNEAVRKPYKDLTPPELKDLRDTLLNIKHVANFENTAYVTFDKADLGEIEAKLVAEQQASAHNEKTAPLSLEKNWRDKLVDQKDAAMFQLISTETWLRKLDGYKNFGPWWKAFYEHYARGADDKAKMLVEAAESYRKIWDAYTPKEREAMNRGVYVPEFGTSLMKSEIITMALNAGNETNLERLIEGRGWTPDVVKSILDREMTKRDWDTVQATWDHIDSYWPKIAELYKELTGFTPEKVERVPFTTQFGEYAGGYFPLRSDPRVEVRGAEQQAVDASLSAPPPAWRASTKNGFTKGRVQGAQYKVSLDINGIQRHITDVIHDLTMRKWVLDANRLLARQGIKASTQDAIGMGGYMMLKDWVGAVAGTNEFQSREFMGDFFHDLRRRTIIANLGLRISSLLLQADDLSAYGRVDPDNFGVKDASLAVLGFYGKLTTDPSHYKTGVEFVNSKSKYMRYERGENLDRDIREAANKTWGKEDKIAKASMSLVTTLDHLLSIPVWTEAYKKGLELHEGNEQKAVDYADLIIRRAQSSGRLGELPAIMRGSEKQKLLTMFYSFTNKRLNMWYEAFDKTHGAKDLPQLAGTAMALWLAPTLFSSMVHHGLPDTPEKKKKYMKDLLLYPTQLVPVVRDAADFLMNKAMGLKSFGYTPTPVTGVVEAAGRLISTAKSDRKTGQDKLEAAASVANYAVPFPNQINAWIFNMADAMNNGMKLKPGDVMRRRPVKERR